MNSAQKWATEISPGFFWIIRPCWIQIFKPNSWFIKKKSRFQERPKLDSPNSVAAVGVLAVFKGSMGWATEVSPAITCRLHGGLPTNGVLPSWDWHVVVWGGTPHKSRFGRFWSILEPWFFLINHLFGLKIWIQHGRIIQKNPGEISVAHFWAKFMIFQYFS